MPSEDRLMNDTTMPPPRRKTAVDVKERGVKTGFGLHDWKRLLQHSNDLAQRKGAPLRRDFTASEVKLHNKDYDGWMILRGRVYNIAPYLHYHPGGVSILKGVLGKDATKLFDKYHQWVNIEGLIGPLCLGVLAVPTKESERTTTTLTPAGALPTSKETSLPNAPRVLPVALATSTLSINDDNNSDDDDDEEDNAEDALFFPPPPPRSRPA
jgi:cytochrome b involved in lipid metabolism